jgi:hypothetical protein
MRQRREAEIDRIRSGIDTSGASVEGAIEFGNTGFGKDTPPPAPPPAPNIPTEITDEEELIKQTKLYQKLLGGDEAKSQAIYDALLAASPAFFKGRNLREAAPEVLTAINKSGAFDKPRDIKQAAAQLAIQRNMLRDKAVAEEKSRLAIYGAKNQETLSETLKNIPGSFIAGVLPEGFKENTNLLRPGGIYSVGNEKFYAVPGDVVDSSGKKKTGVVGLQKL